MQQSLTLDINKIATHHQVSSKNQTNYQRQTDKIQSYILEEKAHLNPDLTLKDLAQGTGISLHDVSEALNHGLGLSFNEFINLRRVDEVKQMLLDPKFNHLSLIAIAYPFLNPIISKRLDLSGEQIIYAIIVIFAEILYLLYKHFPALFFSHFVTHY